MRYRATYAKTEAMRYTGHLDVQRTWERTLRRARLPLVYTQGFNPRPKLLLAAALPLGFTSDCEVVEFHLDSDLPPAEVEGRIREAAPPGIALQTVEAVDSRTPKIPNLVESACYRVTLLGPVNDLSARVDRILKSGTLPRERRGKPYDLRPLIEQLTAADDRTLEMQLAARPGATGRPEEVLLALDLDPLAARIHRTELLLKTG